MEIPERLLKIIKLNIETGYTKTVEELEQLAKQQELAEYMKHVGIYESPTLNLVRKKK
jgi:hypothetical protein